MRNRHKGFTLAEMVVVMGIIVLFVAMAIPTIRSLSGSTSIGMTRNNVSALLARAREEAIGFQAVRGVMFFCDTSTNRIIGVIVQEAVIQDPLVPNCILLDSVPGRETMPLPSGVRLQTVFNGVNQVNSAAGTEDRYLGFNPIQATNSITGLQVKLGGVILFDGNGKLIVRPYGFQMSQPGTPSVTASNLCNLLGITYSTVVATIAGSAPSGTMCDPAISSYEFIPAYTTSATPPPATVLSQVGLILFNYDAFMAQGFTDQDSDIQGTTSYTSAWPVAAGVDGDGVHSEQNEETWLDSNSTPLMVNRFDGTLIRAE